MLKDLLSARIAEKAPRNAIEQELVLQEIMQQYILASLAKIGFFSEAIFHGGTCLKIFFNLLRFSEDLDFLLKKENPSFNWSIVLKRIQADLSRDGIEVEMLDKQKSTKAVQKAFLKTDSVGKIINLKLPFTRHQYKKISIKLEIDCRPPEGAVFETQYLQFPIIMPVTTQTLSTGFSGKIHALLCREYVKGRDWYDFLWYTARDVAANKIFLQNALKQVGPWQGQHIAISKNWLIEALSKKIQTIDFRDTVNDVSRFLPLPEQGSLSQWQPDLFLFQTKKIKLQD